MKIKHPRSVTRKSLFEDKSGQPLSRASFYFTLELNVPSLITGSAGPGQIPPTHPTVWAETTSESTGLENMEMSRSWRQVAQKG